MRFLGGSVLRGGCSRLVPALVTLAVFVLSGSRLGFTLASSTRRSRASFFLGVDIAAKNIPIRHECYTSSSEKGKMVVGSYSYLILSVTGVLVALVDTGTFSCRTFRF